MIDFGSRYNNAFYMGIGFYFSSSSIPTATVVGTITSYRTLTGMGF